MNLAKLFEIQRILDERILEQHPELKVQENLDWKVLALQVELGECANEWRGFKKWSTNQQPSKIIHTTESATTENAVFYQCGDDGCEKRFYEGDNRLNYLFGENDEDCPACEDGLLYAFRKKNPLLEEYVDCLHFILSIGLEMELINTDISERKQLTNRNVTRVFSDLMLAAGTLVFTDWDKPHNYGTVLHGFIYLGELLGFTWEQIEQAYYDKNAINHKRQLTGY